MKTQLALVLPVFLILTAALLFLTGACGSDSTPPAKPVAKATPTAGMPFAYVDVAGPMGYTMRNRTGRDRAKDLIVEAMPPGIAVGDFNGDGWMDMFCPNGNLVKGVNVNQQTPILLSDDEAPRNALYMNREGKRFEDVAKEAGVDGTRWSFGAVAGDIDNDGDTDIFLCNWGKNRLYLNDGTGKFTDVALEAGAAGASRDWSAGAALFDYDGDGDLDIYVAQYADMHAAMADPELVRINPKTGEMNGRTCDWRGLKVYCGPLGLMPQNDVLLESQLAQTGELTFKDVTKKAGLFIEINAESNKEGSRGPYYGFQPIVWDIDGNGHPDVFVANDSVRNVCWMNNGDGTFEDHAEEMGLAVSLDDFVPQASMGVNIADINGDGLQDVVISEFSHDQFNMLVGHRLKDGRVVFDEKSAQTRIREFTFAALGWGVGLLDPDHDGDIDVFFACGHVYPEVNTRPNTGTTYEQLNLMILNLRQDPLKFENVTAKAGPGIASMRRPSRASVAIDFDNDGDPDIATTELNTMPCLLRCDLDRSQGGRHWLQVRLRGNPKKKVPLDPAAAEVTVVTGERRQTRVFTIGSSFQCSEDPRLHFGLGDAAKFDKIEVKWPNGETTEHPGGAADRLIEIRLK